MKKWYRGFKLNQKIKKKERNFKKAKSLIEHMNYGEIEKFKDFFVPYYDLLKRGRPPCHINCRCIAKPITEKESK